MSRYYDVCEALARAAEALDTLEEEYIVSIEKYEKAKTVFKTALEEYRAYMAG